MSTFLVCHGAWSAGWAWKKMRPLMRERGYELFTPSYTGLGERFHLATPDVDLETHIADILGVLEMEDLSGVNLIGHSYGGMVATGVADRARARIAKLIYLDAFAPENGESLMDLVPAELRAQRQTRAPDGWRIPPTPMSADTSPEDVAWGTPRRRPLPAKTFEQKLKLENGPLTLPRHYIYCTRITAGDRFRPFLERARREGWGVDEIDASHTPNITCPEVLMGLLDRAAV
jgi:pimeloyl-ACP methyl ester carboxylesterase